MDPEEAEQLDQCVECSSLIASGVAPMFALGDELVLCFDCAIRRGGQYDVARDRWSVYPSVDGLVSAQRRAL
jgi:hypothetical protein